MTNVSLRAFPRQHYLEIIRVLATRELKNRYRGSILGVYWSLFNPLMMTGLYTAIFSATFLPYYQNSLVNYVLSAFTGLAIVHFFQSSSMQALHTVVANGALLNKIRLPVSVFPLSVIIANVFQLLVGMFPLLVIMTIALHPQLTILLNLLILPLILLTIIFLSAGVGLLASSLYVFFRDLPFFYELILFVLSMTSPIFYPVEILPSEVRPIFQLNPLTPTISSLRQVVLSGNLPDLGLVGHAWLSSVIVLLLGWTVFNRLRPKFMDLL
jgi:ABC-type polysaccharide/polyol phosphate export permease